MDVGDDCITISVGYLLVFDSLTPCLDCHQPSPAVDGFGVDLEAYIRGLARCQTPSVVIIVPRVAYGGGDGCDTLLPSVWLVVYDCVVSCFLAFWQWLSSFMTWYWRWPNGCPFASGVRRSLREINSKNRGENRSARRKHQNLPYLTISHPKKYIRRLGREPPGRDLSFKGCEFHRIIPGFMAQGGDITHGDGTGQDMGMLWFF